MKNTNVIIFSSGVSERRGLLQWLRGELETFGCQCFCWRDLFTNANHSDSIALLPMLIKKIPTFDFAVLICEGHDRVQMLRNGQHEETNTMRDNVLFEIGLCSVALGLNKVILLSDETVRLPEDLMGLNGEVAIKRVLLPIAWENRSVSFEELQRISNDIFTHIHNNQTYHSPVVIGAAASTASGYITNFVFRLTENLQKGFTDDETGVFCNPSLNDIRINIRIPGKFEENTADRAKESKKNLRKATIQNARQRPISFHYKIENGEYIVEDYPTTLVTSYNTAKAILGLSADDHMDVHAEERFVQKELNLFEAALKSLNNKEFFESQIHLYHADGSMSDETVETLWDFLSRRLYIIRENY